MGTNLLGNGHNLGQSWVLQAGPTEDEFTVKNHNTRGVLRDPTMAQGLKIQLQRLQLVQRQGFNP